LGCSRLTSVTFQGKLNDFKYNAFDGDLSEAYFESFGGPGTYKRLAGGETWRKQ